MIIIVLLTVCLIIFTFVILLTLIYTKDGTLRKRLIANFAADLIIFLTLFSIEMLHDFPSWLEKVILTLLVIKCYAKCKLFLYMNPKRKGDSLI